MEKLKEKEQTKYYRENKRSLKTNLTKNRGLSGRIGISCSTKKKIVPQTVIID